MEIQEILAALRAGVDAELRQYMDEAIERREEITPHLIAILEELAEDPDSFLDQDRMDHNYALLLLVHFHEVKAHEVLMRLCHLPEDLLEECFGDILTEDFAYALFQTCGGDFGQIRRLILERDVGRVARGEAIQAFVWGALSGAVSRESVLAFLGTLLTGDEADRSEEGCFFWNSIAMAAMELYPVEIRVFLERAFEEGLIDSFTLRPEELDELLAREKEEVLRESEERLARELGRSVHDRARWWSTETVAYIGRPPDISEQAEEPSQSKLPDRAAQHEETKAPSYSATPRRRRKKKSKRKTAKQSRRKNRR